MMHERFNYVLLSESNQTNLLKAIKNIGKAYNYSFDDNDVKIALEIQLKNAIEHNIGGSRYLTSSNSLKSVNMHIVIKTSQDLKQMYVLKNISNIATSDFIPNSENEIENNISYSRRREVNLDRTMEPPRRDDAPIVIRKMTPRELLK